MTLYKNTESNNNNNIMTEKNFYKRKINVSQSQKFYGKIKKVIKQMIKVEDVIDQLKIKRMRK